MFQVVEPPVADRTAEEPETAIASAAGAPYVSVAVVPVPFRAVSKLIVTFVSVIVAETAGAVAATFVAAVVAAAIVAVELYSNPEPFFSSVACTTAAVVEPEVNPVQVIDCAPVVAKLTQLAAVVQAATGVPVAAVATLRVAVVLVVKVYGRSNPPVNVITAVASAAIAVPSFTVRK